MQKNTQLIVEIGQGMSLMLGLPTITLWENASDRPKNAKRGTFGYNMETNSLEYWDGTFWFAASMQKV